MPSIISLDLMREQLIPPAVPTAIKFKAADAKIAVVPVRAAILGAIILLEANAIAIEAVTAPK